MSDILRIDSVSQIHAMLGDDKPKHPLITLLEAPRTRSAKLPEIRQPVISGLYSISLKNGSECQLLYGRKNYDFQEGTLMFMGPGQIFTPVRGSMAKATEPWEGWVLIFHPDLIRRSTLAKKMSDYSFFSYDSHEALHISEKERETVTKIVKAIEHEYSQNIDDYSLELIVSNIELLLNYCKRFYGRQFITRTNANQDIVVKFENLLKEYFNSESLREKGLPSVKYCAREMGYSPNYLSDLLKKETGKNTQDHIHYHLIEKAKTLLLGTQQPVSTIAYSLGFDYPQHFSKLFKNKTGLSPAKYRH